MSIKYIFCVILLFYQNIVNSYKHQPILFIPGLGGSRLQKNGISIWPPDIKWMLLNPEKYRDMLLHDNELQTLQFGNKKSVDIYSNYMKLFIKTNPFEKILALENLHAIPYDFRNIDRQYILSFNAKLKSYIEEFDEPIKCVTHSSGGLIFHYFLHCQTSKWKKKYIKEVFNVNVPFTGTICSLKQVTQSTIYDFISNIFLFSMGCVIMNFPDKKYMNNPVLIVNNIEKDYIEYFGLQKENEIYRQNEDIINTFSVTNGVKTTIIYSTTTELITPTTIHINNNNDLKKDSMTIIYGEGDGLIPLSSMLHPKIWSRSDLDIVHIKDILHTDVLCSDELISIISSN